MKKASPAQIMAGLAAHRFSDDPQYVPHPSTWLNGERWADQPGGRPALALVAGEQQPPGQLTREQVDDVLGPDPWSLPPPPPGVDMEADPAGFRAWARRTTDAHHRERQRAALARLTQAQAGGAR